MGNELSGNDPFENQGYKTLFQCIPTPIILLESYDRVVRCNRAFSELFGFAEEEILGQSLNDLIVPSALSNKTESIYAEVFDKRTTHYFEATRVCKDGSKIDVAITATPIDVVDRQFAYAVYEDISERKTLESELRKNAAELRENAAELRESEAKFRSIAENAFDPITILDFDGNYLYSNPVEGNIVQADPRDHVGEKAFDYIHPEDRKRVEDVFEEFRAGKRFSARDEIRVMASDGSWIWNDYRASILNDADGNPAKVLTIDRDITAYKRDQERITALLQQKELLLKESHHRIKNNMTTISSLLSYHAGRLEDREAAAILQDSARRTQGMALLYDKLYRCEQYNELGAREYLDSLAGETINLSDPHNTIVATIEAEDFNLNVRVLAPLGIILTELITNSIKHAFQGSDPREISVQFSKHETTACLEYSDNGIGIPESIIADPSTTDGFGLQLIQMLVEQIQGTFSVEYRGGTNYVIEFPIGAAKSAHAPSG